MIVQKISINWFCIINLLVILFNKIDVIEYEIIIVMDNKIIIAWSWKKIKCSIVGELASCKFIMDQVEISKKR